MVNFLKFRVAETIIFQLISVSIILSPSISYGQVSPQNAIKVDQAGHIGGQIPHFDKSSNGTDVLNIVAPTEAGVSHNKFVDFNVNEKGLVVNNSTFQHLVTQNGLPQGESNIGGTVAYNRNLGLNNAARVILNEVTSNSTTSLRGYTEIFGQKAAYVLANPNGITCEGCGFLNTSRLTLTTGRPTMENGDLKDFNLNTSGIIEITGGANNIGLHVDGSPAEIISNMVRIAGLVVLDDDQELDIMTGNQSYDYNNKTLTSDDTHQVDVAVDSSAVGGMYAGRIKIHATQKGFGVHTDGNMVANMDTIEITADGDIIYKNAAAAKKIDITSKGGAITAKTGGTTYAADVISFNAKTDMNTAGEYIYAADIEGKAGRDLTNSGQIAADHTIALSAGGKASNTGEILSYGDLSVAAEDDLTNSSSVLSAGKIHLTGNANVINTGEIASSDSIKIVALGDLTNSGEVSSAGDFEAEAQKNFANSGNILSSALLKIKSWLGFNNTNEMLAMGAMELTSGGDLTNTGSLISLEAMNLAIGYDFANIGAGEVATASDLILSSGRDIINKSGLFANSSAVLTSTRNFSNEGDMRLGGASIISAPDSIFNSGELASSGALFLETNGDIRNQNRINANLYLDLSAANIHNFGQIASNGDLTITTSQDFINYRDSAVLSGGGIAFTVTKNLINYMAEIFALSDITMLGNGNNTSAVDLSQTYDNPFVTDTRDYSAPGNGQPDVQIGEIIEPIQISLTGLNITLTLPNDAFGDDDIYDFGNGFIATLNGDDFIITDEDDTIIAYTVYENSEVVGANPPEGSTEPNENANLGPFANSTPFATQPNAMNSLQNIGGRVESFATINLNTDKLYNIGIDYGQNGYTTEYYKIRDMACWNCGDQELGRWYVSESNFSSIAGMILAGGDLNLSGREILNQSSTLSAKNNIFIKTDSLTNKTSNFAVELLVWYQSRKKSSGKVWNAIWPYYDLVYSKSAALITAGNTLIIDATGGNVFNDQVENPTDGFLVGFDKNPNLSNQPKNIAANSLAGGISVTITLPGGTNGLFVISHDPKYLVVSNVPFLNPHEFAGSDYFFDRILPDSGVFNSRKIIGDAAYETRLVMDALRQATNGHYLSPSIGSDVEQMKALYANAEQAYGALNLKVGVALTFDQIAALTNDIIWYVEKEVGGEKVLVPELYLSQATRAEIMAGDAGAKMTGNTVAIKADTISNSGDIFAKNQLFLKADYLNNESNWFKQARLIGGDSTTIKADLLKNASGLIHGGLTVIEAGNVINETKVYTKEDRFGKNYTLTQKAGQEAEISGDQGLKITAEQAFLNKGAKLESRQGDVLIEAGTAVFDTVELHNREEIYAKEKNAFSKKETSQITDSVKNIGSTVASGGNFVLKTNNDATFKGAVVNVGDSALMDIGGNLNLIAAKDTNYSYSETKKSSMGGLNKSSKSTEAYEEQLKGSNVAVIDGLTIVSGKNTNIIASNVTAGGDAIFNVGDNLTIAAGAENSYLNSSKKESSLGGFKSEKESLNNKSTDLTQSSLSVGGDLITVSGKDTNLIASNVTAGNDANIFAGYKVDEEGNIEKSGNAGSFNMINDWETGSSKYKHEEKDFTNTLYLIAGVPPPDSFTRTPTFERGKFKTEVSLGSKEKTDSYNEASTVVSSNFLAGGNVNLSATDNINIKGSNLSSLENISLTADNDINITSAESNSFSKYSDEQSELKVTTGVGNAYVDLVYVADDLAKATEAVKKAKDELKKMESLESQGRASAGAVNDARANLAAATLNLENATVAMASAIAETATSQPLYGMYAEAGVQYETASHLESTKATVNTGSNIAADKNIIFTAGNNMNQTGSAVVSDNGSVGYKIKNDLNLGASADTFEYASKDSEFSAGATVSTKKSVGANVSFANANNRSASRTYHYSTTTAENGAIIYDVGNDMVGDGYQALAKNIIATVGGDLDLKSKQNYSHSRNSSNSVSMGVTAGFGTKTVTDASGQTKTVKNDGKGTNVSVSQGKGESERLWTDDVSSLIGTESVDIDVKGKLGLEGAMIANIDKNGVDQGNLKIRAGSFEWSDLYDIEKSDQKGYTFGKSSGLQDPGQNVGHPGGSTTIGMTDKGYEKEGLTHATIGRGNVEIEAGSDITGLNRDTDNVQVITKDEITGALDATVTIDDRWFTKDGRASIANDFKNFDENAIKTLKDASVAPITMGAIGYGVIGALVSSNGEMVVDKENNIIRFVTNKYFGLDGTAITLGNAQLYFGESHPDEVSKPYFSTYKMPLSYHEDEHVPQWHEDGAFKFIYKYVKEGLPYDGNSYDKAANKAATIRMINEGIFDDVQTYIRGENYVFPKK